MKVYVEIDLLEKNIIRAREQAHFLRCTLESVDTAIHIKKQKLEEDIAEYNERASNEEKILGMYEDNIATWTNRLDKLYSKQLKKIDKEKVEVVVEKSEKQLRKEDLKAKKKQLAEELKKAKEQIEQMEAAKKEEAEIVEDVVEEIAEEIFKEDFIVEIAPDPTKQECPECLQLFTKGGAFAAHYKTHFPNGNGKE
jgi:chromosome segregation ATPase